MTRTARIELRAEPEREQRIRLAAELANQSMTAFVLEAAAEFVFDRCFGKIRRREKR